MPPRRHVPSPSPKCFPRYALEPGLHPAVDAVLKQLKACSRRLQAALVSHRTELQVLERLYYKGKNQHRTALFWQRVAEMRKLGERLDEMHMDDVVESLRLSYWGEPSVRTTKLLKGPWTHYPDAKLSLFVLERCSACCTLIDRSRERLLSAYESFTLMMQTGAFLQLVLTLAAIASRMSLLLSEVRAVLQNTWFASYTALQTLQPSEAQKVRKLVKANEEELVGSTPILPNATSRAISKVPAPAEAMDEDVGSALVRTTTVHPHEDMIPAVASLPSANEPLSLDSDEKERVDFTTFSLSSELEVGRATRVRHTAGSVTSSHVPTVTSVSTAENTDNAAKRKKSDAEAASVKPAKKKKKKRDEIDDIFGF
ncbi:hypothetical protein BD309DRAFT_995798 [Dichomitus squalens]|nr:hypothetical protein BD309DRAFT_995798 [Dichomitus squalens]